MNYSISSQSNQFRPDSYDNSEWREAKRCNSKCKPPRPEPCSPEVRVPEVRVEEEKETIVIHNSIHAGQLTDQRSDEKFSGTISKLAWLLLGLSSLLFLGSLMFLLAGRAGNNNTNTKETVNNITRTREVVRTEKAADSDLIIYAPRARW